MKIKPGQLVILVLGAVGLVWIAYLTLGPGDGVKLAHRFTMVDVSTGQLYDVSTAKHAIMEPAPLPGGNEDRLVRVKREDSGKWVVAARSLPLLKDLPVNPEIVNPETGEVLKPSSGIETYRH